MNNCMPKTRPSTQNDKEKNLRFLQTPKSFVMFSLHVEMVINDFKATFLLRLNLIHFCESDFKSPLKLENPVSGVQYVMLKYGKQTPTFRIVSLSLA